ncbi:MAG: efflux transporter outer membrane subunit [Planctomycetota bacterium]|nr:efflux transporter outer membrane subunit [Planctomycetota bacterium]
MIRPWIAAAVLAALGLAACRVGPRHEEPRLDFPAQFAESGTNVPVPADELWWRRFGDPTLDALVERAIAGNVDLAIARERVLEARALRDAVAGGKLPSVDARAGVSRVGPSEDGAFSRGGDYSLYEAGLVARWEVDLFGRIDAQVEAAEAGVGSAIETRQAALVVLLAEVAREYVALRGTQRELAILRANLATQRDTLDLTRVRETAGLSPELDVARSEAQVETTAAAIPAFEANARASIHRLGVLTGEMPGALLSVLAVEAPIPLAPAGIEAGLPLDVVRRRPDVRRSERELARATALTAQATADLYPRITLSASLGQEAQTASGLFDASSNAWSIGAGLLAPLFDGGTLRANLRAQEARRAQAALAWKGVVLDALREVEDALANLGREREREARLAAAVAASQRALVLARDLNQQGLVDFFDVLDAQRAVLSAETQLVQSQSAVSTGTVALYKALGGAPALEDPVQTASARSP